MTSFVGIWFIVAHLIGYGDYGDYSTCNKNLGSVVSVAWTAHTTFQLIKILDWVELDMDDFIRQGASVYNITR